MLAVILNSDSCSDQFLAGGTNDRVAGTLGLNAAWEKDWMGFDETDIQQSMKSNRLYRLLRSSV